MVPLWVVVHPRCLNARQKLGQVFFGGGGVEGWEHGLGDPCILDHS